MTRFPNKKSAEKLAALFLMVFLILPQLGLANPEGGNVVHGTATISQPTPRKVVVGDVSDKAIIEWRSFSINRNEITQFIQVSKLASVLNRVVGVDPSLIFGKLEANGRIFLINRNGILFGRNATVDVGGLLASTLNISNQGFINNRLTFLQDASYPHSFVVNLGTLNASNKGYIALLAPFVYNGGTIQANVGRVILAGRSQATLNLDGEGLVNFVLESPSPTHRDVHMAKDAFIDLMGQVVNNKDIIEAGRVVSHGDDVTLVGSSEVAVNAGTIRANGAANRNAGSVLVTGTQAAVTLPNSLIQANALSPIASSSSSGGNVQLLSQGVAYFSPNSTLEAKGAGNGRGGRVEVSADRSVWMNGRVDTSSEHGVAGTLAINSENLNIANVSRFSPANTISVGLLEGTNRDIFSVLELGARESITVANITGGTIHLKPNVSLAMTTKTGDILFLNPTNTIQAAGNGGFLVNAGATAGSGGKARLGNLTTANHAITVNSDGDLTYHTLNTGTGAVSLTSLNGTITDGFGITAGDLNLRARSIGTSNTPIHGFIRGILNATASSGLVNYSNTGNLATGTISANGTGHGIALTASGAITGNDSRITGNGDITLRAGTNLTLFNSLVSSSATASGENSASGNVSLTAGNNLTVNRTSSVTSDMGNISLYAGNNARITNIRAGGDVTVEAVRGSITSSRGRRSNLDVAGNSISLKARTGIGTPAQGINTQTQILTTATSGLAAKTTVHNQGALESLDVTTNNGDVNIDTTTSESLRFVRSTDLLNAAMVGTDVRFNNTGGNIVVDTVDVGLDNNLTLISSGAITARPGVSNNITANTANLFARFNIGSADEYLKTQIKTLNANAADGGIFVNNTLGNLTLSSVSAHGANHDVNIINNTGDLFVGTVSSDAGVILNNRVGSITGLAGHDITGQTATLTAGTFIGTLGNRLNTDVSVINATANNGGVFIGNSLGTALTLNNVVSRGMGSNVDVLKSRGDLRVNQVSSGGDVTLNAVAGAIEGTSGANSITGNTAHLTAGTHIGSLGTRLNTDVSVLNATANNGGVFIGNSLGTALTLNNVVSRGMGSNVDVLKARGDLRVNQVSSGGDVTLNAVAGAIEGTSGANSITGNTAHLTAGTHIGSLGTRLNTDVSVLNATANNGGVFIGNSLGTALTLNNVVSRGMGSNVDVLKSRGDLRVNQVSSDGNVTLNAATGAILGIANNKIKANTIDLTAGVNIGTLATRLNTDALILNATARDGGIFIGNSQGNPLTLNRIVATGNIDILKPVGDLSVNFVSSGADVTLSAGGAIGSGVFLNLISGDALSLNAGLNIGALSVPLITNVSKINAFAANGGINLINVHGPLTLGNVSARGAGNDVNIANFTGNLFLGAVSSDASVRLFALNGSIFDNTNNGLVNITSLQSSLLSATNGVIGILGDPIRVSVSSGTLDFYSNGNSNGVSGNLAGVVLPSNTLNLLNPPPGKVFFNGLCIFGCPPLAGNSFGVTPLNQGAPKLPFTNIADPYLFNLTGTLWEKLLAVPANTPGQPNLFQFNLP